MNALYPPQFRLRKGRDFARMRGQGDKLYTDHFLIVVVSSSGKDSRLGIVITKKVDKKATVRNTIKRHIREVFRTNRERISRPVDILVIARKNAGTLSSNEIHGQFLGALNRKHLLAEEKC